MTPDALFCGQMSALNWRHGAPRMHPWHLSGGHRPGAPPGRPVARSSVCGVLEEPERDHRNPGEGCLQ